MITTLDLKKIYFGKYVNIVGTFAEKIYIQKINVVFVVYIKIPFIINKIDIIKTNLDFKNKFPDKIIATIYMHDKGLAVFSEVYYPNGWKCKINNSNINLIFLTSNTISVFYY